MNAENKCEMKKLFELGMTLITPGAEEKLSTEIIAMAMIKYMSGDWGDTYEQDKKANYEALLPETQGRLMGVYKYDEEKKFYIITEWDRSVTTILLPEEY